MTNETRDLSKELLEKLAKREDLSPELLIEVLKATQAAGTPSEAEAERMQIHEKNNRPWFAIVPWAGLIALISAISTAWITGAFDLERKRGEQDHSVRTQELEQNHSVRTQELEQQRIAIDYLMQIDQERFKGDKVIVEREARVCLAATFGIVTVPDEVLGVSRSDPSAYAAALNTLLVARYSCDERKLPDAFPSPPVSQTIDRPSVNSSEIFDKIAPIYMQKLIDELELTDFQAAGLLGNIGHETTGLQALQELRPIVAGSRGSFGWGGWTGPRRRSYEAWAEANGLDIRADEANYGFLKHELESTEKNALRRLRETTDLREATRSAMEKLFRPGIKHFDRRTMWADRAMLLFRLKDQSNSSE